MPPHKRRAEYIKLGLGIAVVGTVLLAATGKLPWVGAAFTALLVAARQGLPLIIRLFPMLASLRHKSAPSGGQGSKVETALLRMQLDHDTGNLEGEVLAGNFKGWRLADMDRQQLEEFCTYCRSEDADSLQLLDSYLQQRFPGAAGFAGQQQDNPGSSHTLGRTEALAVLGLSEGASREEITAAHRQLIQKLHPDRGGNDYLAAQINQAKDLLLG
ncbi:MAG: DnaJ domain-containing protein [Halioglobus sp.]|nr:DnaJ domain-containing protein [Halioglobus sp.]